MKAFYFLNIYCSFLQLQHRKVTLLSLEGGLKQLSKFGFGCEYSDLENLSVFCPQVIQFLDNDAECKRSNNAIVVIKSKSDLEYQIKGKPKRKMSTTRLVNAMRKREGAFRSDLWAAVKSFMEKKGKETIKSLSVSDLLLHVTEGNHKATKTDAKRTRKSISEPANSFSPEVQCNETNPLLPTEMVEHLKAGLGSQGQMGGVGSMCGSITAPIQRRQKLLSVVFLVVFPYLKSKLHSIYNKEREAAVQASLWGNVNERFGEIGDVRSSFGNISQPGYVSNMTQGQTQTFRDGFSVGGMSQVHFDLMDKGTDAVGGKLLVTMDICRAFDQIYKEHLDGMCL